MCLILLAWRVHSRFPLVVAANRDELHARPTAALAPWEDAPGLAAGRDLEAGGTWLGVRSGGRFAALTNFRAPGAAIESAPSRGALVAGFLTADDAPQAHARRLWRRAARYNGFNLVLAAAGEAVWISNRGGRPSPLAPGLHGISNGLLDEPWPKVTEGRDALAAVLGAGADPDFDALLAVLADRGRPPDDRLPATGVGIERERLLAPRFIDATYGTRSSTVLAVDARGRATIVERTFDAAGAVVGDRRLEV